MTTEEGRINRETDKGNPARCLVEKWRRRKNVRRVFAGIRLAQDCYPFVGKPSKTYALRGVRRFEKINKVNFNPKDPDHRMRVRGSGRDESFFRGMDLIFQRQEKRLNAQSRRNEVRGSAKSLVKTDGGEL